MNNKNIKSVICAILASAMVMSGFTGCGSIEDVKNTATNILNINKADEFSRGNFKSGSEEPCNLAVIYGNIPGAFMPDLSDPMLSEVKEDIMAVSYYGGSFYAVVPDGSPSNNRVSIGKIKAQDTKSDEYRQSQAEEKFNEINESLENCVAKVDECDMLEAIRAAADSIRGEEGEYVIDILAPMVSTTGRFSLVEIGNLETVNSLQDLNDEQIELIIKNLEEQGNIPDLTDITVNVYGLGNTTDELNALTTNDKTKLGEIWRRIIEAGGGTFKDAKKSYNGSVNTSSCSITKIKVGDEGSIFKGVDELNADNATDEEKQKLLTDGKIISFFEKVSFIPDSTELVDPDAAYAALESCIDIINKSDSKFIIAGCTTSFGNDPKSSEEFSYKRALTVRDLMVSRGGVDEGKILCAGAGYSCNLLTKDDKNSDGTLNEEVAAQNRKVCIIGSDCDAYEEVLKYVR